MRSKYVSPSRQEGPTGRRFDVLAGGCFFLRPEATVRAKEDMLGMLRSYPAWLTALTI
jgi:hypothetical protein